MAERTRKILRFIFTIAQLAGFVCFAKFAVSGEYWQAGLTFFGLLISVDIHRALLPDDHYALRS